MSACLITGTEKVRCGYGNGDCLLLDFRRGVYAVADATERFSSSSNYILQRLERRLSQGDPPRDSAGWHDLFDELYREQEYRHKTTFSCIVLQRSAGGSVSINVISGGDSVVMVTGRNGELLFRTSADMNFAGRSRHAGDVHTVEVCDRGARVTIFTDGLQDLARHQTGEGLLSGIPAEFMREPVDSVAERVFAVVGERETRFEHDDIGLVALNPFRAASAAGESIILGGTTPSEESQFQKMHISDNDRFMPTGSLEDFPGITKSP